MLTASEETSWDKLQPFLEHSGSSHFVRNLVRGIDELYDLNGEGITEENWQSLDTEIRQRHSDPHWPHKVMKRAGVSRIITDNYADPFTTSLTNNDFHGFMRETLTN